VKHIWHCIIQYGLIGASETRVRRAGQEIFCLPHKIAVFVPDHSAMCPVIVPPRKFQLVVLVVRTAKSPLPSATDQKLVLVADTGELQPRPYTI
jgi:hypothetical protein